MATQKQLLMRHKKSLIFLAVSTIGFIWALLPYSKLAENIFGGYLMDDSQALGLIVPYALGWIFSVLAVIQFVREMMKAEKQGKTKRPKGWVNTSK